jgi:hypothetical protein
MNETYLMRNNCFAHYLCCRGSGGWNSRVPRIAVARGVLGAVARTTTGAVAGPGDCWDEARDNEPGQATAQAGSDGESQDAAPGGGQERVEDDADEAGVVADVVDAGDGA